MDNPNKMHKWFMSMVVSERVNGSSLHNTQTKKENKNFANDVLDILCEVDKTLNSVQQKSGATNMPDRPDHTEPGAFNLCHVKKNLLMVRQYKTAEFVFMCYITNRQKNDSESPDDT